MVMKVAASNPIPLSSDALSFMEVRIEYDTTFPIYIGYASTPNANVDAEVWFIRKLTNDGDGNPEYVQLPNEGVKFGYSWTDRATYFP